MERLIVDGDGAENAVIADLIKKSIIDRTKGLQQQIYHLQKVLKTTKKPAEKKTRQKKMAGAPKAGPPTKAKRQSCHPNDMAAAQTTKTKITMLPTTLQTKEASNWWKKLIKEERK